MFTVVVNSIDRSTENKAPNRCLPFDPIGARHPGIVVLSRHTPAANGNLVPAPGVIRDAEPQQDQKVNNDSGLYSLWNAGSSPAAAMGKPGTIRTVILSFYGPPYVEVTDKA